VLIDDDLFTVIGWYDAAEVLFMIGLILLVFAIIVESTFACFHCGLHKAWVPAAVGSLTLGGGIRQLCTGCQLVILNRHASTSASRVLALFVMLR